MHAAPSAAAATAPAAPHPSATQPISAGLARAVDLIAGVLALLVAIVPPTGYFTLRYASEAMVARYEADQIAHGLTALIAAQPDGWTFQYLTLHAHLAPLALATQTPERRVLTSISGAVLAEVTLPDGSGAVRGPTLVQRAAAMDFGWPVATVTVTRSLGEVVVGTALVALAAAAMALLAFFAMRTVPLALLRRAVDRAAWLATHDPLTGLPNRALFRERLAGALAQARRDGSVVAVLYLDLDHFKEVNDTLGHGAGDRLLREVTRRLSDCVRETDTLARLGGDEFAIVQTNAGQPQDSEALAQRLIATVAQPYDLDGNQVVIGTSIGIALGEGTAEPARLLQEADLALYQAKDEGRSAFRFFETGMNERLLLRKALEADLREALAQGQFRLAFQPQVELKGPGNLPVVVGAEALIRWHHPVRGEIRPDQFIALAEENGLILPIGAWVLREACRRAAGWPAHLGIAVNVSAVQFAHAGFVELVKTVLAETGLAPSRLELELTEGILMSDTDATIAQLERLRAIGVRLAMDDFGTGYSSLGYLRKFRFDKIKIDRSFVSHLGADAEAQAIVRAIVRISQALGMRSNAEGVETDAQADMLNDEGCGEVQGFLYGAPMPPEAFEARFAPAAGTPEAEAARRAA